MILEVTSNPGHSVNLPRCLEHTGDSRSGQCLQYPPASSRWQQRAAALSGGARAARRHFQQRPGTRLCCPAAGCPNKQRQRIHTNVYPLLSVPQHRASRACYCAVERPVGCPSFSRLSLTFPSCSPCFALLFPLPSSTLLRNSTFLMNIKS